MMCRMQAEVVDICCYYDARWGVSDWGGMFHPYTGKPLKTYYSFKTDSNKTFEEDNSLVNGKLYDITKESVITVEWVK